MIGQYEIWAPAPTLRIQEDFSTLYSPNLYHAFLQGLDRHLATLAECTLLHLHSSSLFLVDAFLEIEEINTIQVTKDQGRVKLADLLPALRRIQAAGKPLVLKGQFESGEWSLVREGLSPVGLCIEPVVGSFEEAKRRLPEFRGWKQETMERGKLNGQNLRCPWLRGHLCPRCHPTFFRYRRHTDR